MEGLAAKQIACEDALKTAVRDEKAEEALQTLHSSLRFDLADLRVRLSVVVRATREEVPIFWTPDEELEELYMEFGDMVKG